MVGLRESFRLDQRSNIMTKRTYLVSTVVWFAILIFIPFAASRAGAAAMYAVTDLGTMPGYSSSIATGINNRGQIVGYCNTGNNWDSTSQAFLYYSFGYMQGLGSLPGLTSSFATGINDNGFVVGYCYNEVNFFNYRAFL